MRHADEAESEATNEAVSQVCRLSEASLSLLRNLESTRQVLLGLFQETCNHPPINPAKGQKARQHMGLLSWITGKHFDEQPDPNDEHANDPYWSEDDTEEDNVWIGGLAKRRDEEIAANPTPYGAGQAGARMQIDDMRRYWHQYGASSFREAVEVSGKYWHHIVQIEQELIAQGHTERQEYLEYALGARSMFD